jgi:hypothetical protein
MTMTNAPQQSITQRSDRDPSTGRFLPGNNANPGGSKGRPSLTAAIGRRIAGELPDGRTKLDAIADRLIDIALNEPPRVAVQAMTEILKRLDGTPGKLASEPERVTYQIRFTEAIDPTRLEAAAE